MPYPKLDKADIAYLTGLVGEKYIQVGDSISEDYAHDELGETRAFPEVMLEPDSAETVAEIMGYAYEKGIPVTTRGSGTGLCGGCVPLHGGILLSTARLNRVLEIDSNNLTATVESGVVLMDFQEVTEKMGFLYAQTRERKAPPLEEMLPPMPGACVRSSMGSLGIMSWVWKSFCQPVSSYGWEVRWPRTHRVTAC